MHKELQIHLKYFKEYTMEMISSLNEDDIDNFEVALEKRTQIIGKINFLKFDKSEFNEICKQLNIMNLNNELSKIINNERDRLKEKILEIKKTQTANTAYQLNFNKNNIFSKKV